MIADRARYTLDANDIDAVGLWQAQARVVLGPGDRFRSQVASFFAEPVL